METRTEQQYAQLLEQAAAELKRQQHKIQSLESQIVEPIAVVGMGCRFPQAANPDEFWAMQINGIDATSPVPENRFNVDQWYDPNPGKRGTLYVRSGGFLRDVAGFDHEFFGVSAREARAMDPQHRLLLEVTWEALEHACIVPLSLEGSRTGVFVGIMNQDYVQLSCADPAGIDMYTAAGSGIGVAAGRLAYSFGFEGPAIAVDTNCSSSLVAAHLACQALRSGECDLAVVGGVNCILTPMMSLLMCRAQALSKDGRCKAFSASADGYGRGEGCGVVVLKRRSEALSDNNRIICLIRGSAVNHGGRSSALPVPNGLAQQRVMRAALNQAKLDPRKISYVEAHGTGTALGDPIEIEALQAVYGTVRTKDDPLIVGTVKTNIGHLEGAAGIAGLIRTVQILERAHVPPNLHFDAPNPNVDWGGMAISIPTERTPLSQGNEPLLAGVSAFGFCGTNAHVLVEKPALGDERPGVSPATAPREVFCLSAKTPESAAALRERYVQYLARDEDIAALRDICWSSTAGRQHFRYRMSIVTSSCQDLLDQLRSADTVFRVGQRNAVLAFHFGDPCRSQTSDALVSLRADALFRKYSEEAAQHAENFGYVQSFLEALHSTGGPSPVDAPSGFASLVMQFALSQYWLDQGLKPSVVLGQGLGEYAAAFVSGIMSLPVAVRSATQALESRPRHPSGSTRFAPAPRTQRIQAFFYRDGRWVEAIADKPSFSSAEEIFAGRFSGKTVIALDFSPGSAGGLRPGAHAPIAQLRLIDAHSKHEAIAELYVEGVDFEWNRLYSPPPGRFVDLPTYAFQRTQLWVNGGEYKIPARDVRRVDAAGESLSGNIRNANSHAKRRRLVAEYLQNRLIRNSDGDARTMLLDEERRLQELGIDSLAVMEVLEQLSVDLGRDVRPDLFAPSKSVATVIDGILHAVLADGENVSDTGHLVTIQEGHANSPLLVMFHAVGGLLYPYYGLVQLIDPERRVLGFQSVETEPEHLTVTQRASLYAKELVAYEPDENEFVLVGWSMGGLLAIETARELKRVGRKVMDVVAIDPQLARTRNGSDTTDDILRLGLIFFALDIGVPKDKALALPAIADFPCGPSRNQQLSYLISLAPRFRDAGLSLSIESVEQRFEIFWGNLMALNRYEPRYYPGPLTVIGAGEGIFTGSSEIEVLTIRWSALAEKVVQHDLSANHFSIMQAPHVEDLASIIQEVLARNMETAEAPTSSDFQLSR